MWVRLYPPPVLVGGRHPPLGLALKSGNFDAKTFSRSSQNPRAVMTEVKGRAEIVKWGRSLFERGLTSGSSGNISVKLKDGLEAAELMIQAQAGATAKYQQYEDLAAIHQSGVEPEARPQPLPRRSTHKWPRAGRRSLNQGSLTWISPRNTWA